MLVITVRQTPVRYAIRVKYVGVGHELYLSKAPGGSQLVDFPERFPCFIAIVQDGGVGWPLNQVGVF